MEKMSCEFQEVEDPLTHKVPKPIPKHNSKSVVADKPAYEIDVDIGWRSIFNRRDLVFAHGRMLSEHLATVRHIRGQVSPEIRTWDQ